MRAQPKFRAARWLAALTVASATLAVAGARAASPGCNAVNAGALSDSASATNVTTTLSSTFAAGDVITLFYSTTSAAASATLQDTTAGVTIGPQAIASGNSVLLSYTVTTAGPRTFVATLTSGAISGLTIISGGFGGSGCAAGPGAGPAARADAARLMTGFVLRQVIPQNAQTISDMINERMTGGTSGPQFSAVPGRMSFRASRADLARLSPKPAEPRHASGPTQLAAAAAQPSLAAAELRRKLAAIDRAIAALDNLPAEARSDATRRSQAELVRRRGAIAAELARSGEPATAPAAPKAPTPGGPTGTARRLGEPIPLNVWASGSVIGLDDRRDSTAFNGTITTVLGGADYLFGPNFLLGLAGGYERYRLDTTFNTGFFKGEGITVGPYAGVRVVDNIVLDAWAGATFLNYRITDEFGGDNFSARRWFVSANLTGTWQWGRWRFAPRASIFYVEERQDGIEGVDGSQIVRLGRLSLGPEAGYALPLESERPRVELFGFAKAEYDFVTDESLALASGPFRHQRWGGRVGGGTNIAWQPGFTARLMGSYNGLGQNNFDSWSGEVRIGLKF